MSQKLQLDGYKWNDIKTFTSDFVKNYDVDGDEGYLLEVDVECSKDLLSAMLTYVFYLNEGIKYLRNMKK